MLTNQSEGEAARVEDHIEAASLGLTIRHHLQ